MGKSKQKKDKGGNAAAAIKKCTCEHPFTCECGNRPERPTRGHKWDPESQQWGGKGHKQKGGSGQTSQVGTFQEAKVTEKGKTQVAQWQKLPSGILREYCDKQRRPPPKFKELLNGKTSFKCRCICPDPKKKPDKDLIIIPAKPVQNEEQAKEEAALLALLHLTPKLPHERKLPEPYKTTWLAAVAQQKSDAIAARTKEQSDNNRNNSSNKVEKDLGSSTVSNSSNSARKAGASSNINLTLGTAFTSHSEKRKLSDQKRQVRNARIRKHEAVRMANRDHPVFLSARLRNSIQKILRGDFAGLLSNNDDENDEDNPELNEFGSDLQCCVEERLHGEGFTKRQARTAFDQKGKGKETIDEEYWEQVYDDCLQWLCVHLDEDQLPEGFDPRGSTLEVVAAPNSTSTGAVGNNTGEASRTAEKFGISIRDASWLLQQQQKQQKDSTTETPLEGIFWNQIVKIANVDVSEENCESHVNENENKEMVQDEFEAIEAMFQSDCALKTGVDGKSSTIIIKTPEMMDIRFTFSQIYPSVFPTRILFLGKWERPVGVAFHVKIAQYLSTLPLGDPMLFEIYGEAQNIIQSLEDLPFLPLSATSVPATIDKESSGIHSSSSSLKKTTTKAKSINKRRPRTRSAFWSTPPEKTTPATPFCWSKSMERQRKSLPAWKARDDFLSKLDESCKSGNRVVLVTGDTGCGKTTQIPQFILEENPTSAKIVIAQPRRLAATGVAGRVADERGENQPGRASVGYVVRGDSAFCKDTRLLFCTFGILLRQLQSEGALDSITHIVIDEVHERNLDGDILMGLLRKSLKTVPHLKVILMSATLDADRFAAYWGNAPRLHIPGRTFPVQDFMLEDVLELTGYNPPKKKRKQGGFNNYRQQNRRTSPWNDSEKSDDEMDNVEEEDASTEKNADSSETKEEQPQVSLEERVKRVDQTSVDYFLLAFLVKYIVQSNQMGSDGSILVFLQGVGEISQAQTIVGNITKGMSVLLLPLHGSLQPQEQSKIFRNTPGQVKVILSTNVAETSITIPDCTVVIDSCREKQSSYDPINRMPMLLDQFASKASLKQRRGRAGRVRSGKCYKLISKATFSKLNDHTAPEISRCALDQTLLSLLFLGAEDGTGRFLQRLLDPPSQASVNAATSSLQKMGALEQAEAGKLRLSPLGMHLAGIPANPSIGKLLVMGSILGCRTGALAMAAGLSVGRSPFLRVDGRSNRNSEDNGKNQLILEERSKLFETCGNSDHSMIAAAFMNWNNLPTGGGRRKRYCESLGLSFNGMRDIAQLVNQYGSSLSISGFPSSVESDRNAQSWRVLRTCAISAMAPDQLVRVYRPSTKYEDTAEGAKLKEGEARGHKFYIRVDNAEGVNADDEKRSEERVFIHPSSNMFSVGTYSCPWLVFHSMIRTSKPFLREATECSAYSLLLFGGPLTVEARNSVIHIDGWVRLSANAKIGALIQGLRSKMDDLLRKKIDNPTISISDTPEMQLIVKLLVTDGLG